MLRTPRSFIRFALFTALAASATASAEPSFQDVGSLQLRYAVVMRQGFQTDIGPGLAYQGFTPNDLAASAVFYPLDLFGFGASVEREAFSLRSGTTPIAAGSLLRGYAGPTARLGLGPVRLEALLGYSFSQLPLFGSSVDPSFGAAVRHGAVGVARLKVALPMRMVFEARGEYPLPLAVLDAGAGARADGFSAGASLGMALGHVGRLGYALVGNYDYHSDRLTGADGTVSGQTLSRFGAAVEFTWLHKPPPPPPPPPPKYGGVAFTVLDAQSGAPLANAKISLTPAKGKTPVAIVTDEKGLASLPQTLEPGTVVATVALGGYLPADGKADVVAGQTVPLEIRAKKEPPKVGGVRIILVDKVSGGPVSNAVVLVRGAEYKSDAAGMVVVAGQKPGPAQVQVKADGYRPAQDFATVVAFKTATVPITMNKVEQKALATLRGIVRARGVGPLAATLEVPEQKLKTRASGAGAFTVRVPGGTYRVIISAPGYLTQTKSVTVRDGDQAIFNVDLHQEKKR